MPTTIEVNKQSVEALLGSGKSKPFVIPEYQRPYAWTDEQVETLFEDLWDFTATSGGTERESSYFLGSVVSYENEDGEQEIIDGQQRITSLFLLLRAIYTKLVATPASERTAEANNFIGKIEPTIWRTNKLNFTDICRTGKCMGTDIDDDFLHPVCDNIIPFSLLGRDVYLLIYVTSDVCLVDCDMAEKCEKQ